MITFPLKAYLVRVFTLDSLFLDRAKAEAYAATHRGSLTVLEPVLTKAQIESAFIQFKDMTQQENPNRVTEHAAFLSIFLKG